MNQPPVVALVVGLHADGAVVRWAASEAAHRGSNLLVTALPSVRSADRGQTVARLLDEAVALARLQEPELEVRADRSGIRGYQHVVALTLGADVLVVATRPGDSGRSAVRGPLVDQLAVDAHCPVVAFSPMAAARATMRHGEVVVGWSRDLAARTALGEAAEAAAARGARLTVIAISAAAEGAAAQRSPGKQDQELDLAAAVAEVEQRHPELTIDLLHRKGAVAPELCRAVRQSDLLVVGCCHSDRGWTSRPGSVASIVMRVAPCPVLLVGADAMSRMHATEPQPAARPADVLDQS